jgi:serine/threonine protein kinase
VQEPAEPVPDAFDATGSDPKAGNRLGAYRLEREIGRGGMGEVYLATRADSEFVKQVAIKLIRCGKENEFTIRRFRNERQILARIEHPYVARLIDGGTTSDGLPYFVMEYVDGQPINIFCDKHNLSNHDRLELFIKICSAVEYAHERNILHRDLKPSNILVKENGTPKLLDFGIAKIVGVDLTATTGDLTLAGFHMLTPAYASPEQMRGDPATVRSDVYSLGVVLYELLCGERPSLTAFETSGAAAEEESRDAQLPQDLRYIVSQAMRLNPRERYPSIQAFSADLRRYLKGISPAAASQTLTQPATTSGTTNHPLMSRTAKRRFPAQALSIGAAVAFVLASFFGFRALNKPAPFSSLKFTKLTMNGTADSGVISPDGERVAYTLVQNGKTSLWLRELKNSGAVELHRNLAGEITALAFTNNGRDLSYVNYSSKQPSNRRLYLLSVAGGLPREFPKTFPGPVGISRDGAHLASFRSNREGTADELWITNANSGAERAIASYRYPQRFAWSCTPSWSPDGKLIATAVEENDEKGFLVRLAVFDARTGEKRAVSSPRWQWVQHIAWSGKADSLAVVGQEQDSSFQQIWYVPYRRGKSRRIGDDLDNYIGASLTTRGAEMVSVQQQTLSDIYVLHPGDVDHPVQITPGTGRYFDLSWMPDGRILYASDATGSADLWLMNADGSGQRQITSGQGRSYAPVPSPEGELIAFHSNRSGNWHIWRIRADGTDARQLTGSLRDGNWPQFTPDGNFIIFHQTDLKGSFNLWKIPSTGGRALRLTQTLTMHPAVSHRTAKIASWYSATSDDPHWKLAVFGPEGGEPLQVFDPAVTVRPDTLLRWTPDGRAITFLEYRNGVSNIWIQPVDGGVARRLTKFTSGEIFSFDWSRNGSLVYSRGLTTADVVLIKDSGRLP